MPSTGSGLSAATIAKLDSAIVDITADVAGGGGQVAGTGMIITSNGEVLTNNHVIADTINIRAQIDGTGTAYQVKVIGYDATDDVALVQLVGASNLPTVPIGDSSKVAAGDSITVLGNALGRGGTPAEVGGTVTELDAQITASDDSGDTETLTGMLQVSAQIEPGDSGGPEVNAAGQVIGITTAGQTSGNPNQQQTQLHHRLRDPDQQGDADRFADPLRRRSEHPHRPRRAARRGGLPQCAGDPERYRG